MSTKSIELELGSDQALAAIGEAAEVWGAEFERRGSGGRLVLPVTAGLRLGELSGTISCTQSLGNGTEVHFHEQESRYQLRLAHFVVLLLGGLGGILTVFMPFFPQLLGLLPVSGLLLLLAWFLVASRLHTSGSDEFLDLVKEIGEAEEGAEDGAAAG